MSLREIFEGAASGDVALCAPDMPDLTFGGLKDQIVDTIGTLRGLGIERNDRVAIVLPNGPVAASAFLSIASGATSAPLNPQYRAEEFEFYLSDLNAKALVIEAGMTSPAIEVANRLGVRVIELEPTPKSGAGRFRLKSGAASGPVTFAGADDVALVLHTSGTTSRPKIVPLNQANICASAGNIRSTLRFSKADRGLNIMPLFHIHGLMAGLLAPLSAGGSVYCTPGFNALKFFGWLEAARPTWYSAVPTMHQAILARASHNAAIVKDVRLRFIRSSSSSLPPQVFAEIESVFGAPMLEAYGMTEASHQMASNPLPPGARKAGTVGVAAGPEVAIMDGAGTLLEAGAIGEIVIRGPNVTKGYENNPKANAEAFTNGWFRTGDQGRMDESGYVSITGRLKEIINRGGEKISPREVDEVLMDHPAVQQVVTFAIPHDKLGEEVGAAIVLREGQTADERSLRAFAAIHLADFKVPRKIVILDEIPKGPTGKLQRIGLAQKLGLAN